MRVKAEMTAGELLPMVVKEFKELGMRDTLESDTLCLKKNFQVIPDSKTVGELIDTRLMKQGFINTRRISAVAFRCTCAVA